MVTIIISVSLYLQHRKNEILAEEKARAAIAHEEEVAKIKTLLSDGEIIMIEPSDGEFVLVGFSSSAQDMTETKRLGDIDPQAPVIRVRSVSELTIGAHGAFVPVKDNEYVFIPQKNED